MQLEGSHTHYGVSKPEMTQFGAAVTGTRSLIIPIAAGTEHLHQPAEVASPISTHPQRPTMPNVDELAAGVPGNSPDDEEAERGIPGNRWPRQETLALIKIRSEMDGAFRDPSTHKGPLWDEVARKLAEEGYTRSAKKCKEKFENVHKYYKRTKDKSGGRQDGKSYRFFSQLEALTNSVSGPATTTTTTSLTSPTPPLAAATTTILFGAGTAGRFQPTPISSVAPPPPTTLGTMAGISPAIGNFTFSTSSSSTSDSEGEETEEGAADEGQRKRKRGESGGKMSVFFKGLMQQVMERQEAMQVKFLEAIEKREQDRMIREEAWKRQESARLGREHELIAHERAVSASKDAAIISFLQNMTGQPVPLPHPITPPTAAPPPQPTVQLAPPPQPPATFPPPPPQQPQEKLPLQQQNEKPGGPIGTEAALSSRWPKAEVHALIKLRSEMESKYQEAGPKGPLWEEISAGMRRLGYNRSVKRCKEKWENINKYFKKVKESNKKRPEDAKTCPYFHQLEALYRNKIVSGGTNAATSSSAGRDQAANTSNGGHSSSIVHQGTMKKPEDILKELMEHNYDKLEEHENDNTAVDDDDDEEQQNMAYKIEFQRPNVSSISNNGPNQQGATGTTTTTSYMAMVQ